MTPASARSGLTAAHLSSQPPVTLPKGRDGIGRNGWTPP
jgi:hypothetical protein